MPSGSSHGVNRGCEMGENKKRRDARRYEMVLGMAERMGCQPSRIHRLFHAHAGAPGFDDVDANHARARRGERLLQSRLEPFGAGTGGSGTVSAWPRVGFRHA